MLGRDEVTPITDRDRFLSEFSARFQGVKSWQTPLMPEKRPFRDWGYEALQILGQGEVALFDRKNHLSPGYTGFVRNVVPPPDGEADFEYIKDGVLIFTQKDKSRRFAGVLEYRISWRDGAFIIDETYTGSGFPENNEVLLTSRTKEAKFTNEIDNIRVRVQQASDDTITIVIADAKEKREKLGGVLEMKLTPGNPDYQAVIARMQSEPELFSSTKQIVSLLTGIPIAGMTIPPGSNGNEYTFAFINESGELYGDPEVKEKIKKGLPFEKALLTVFPSITK